MDEEQLHKLRDQYVAERDAIKAQIEHLVGEINHRNGSISAIDRILAGPQETSDELAGPRGRDKGEDKPLEPGE
jgi:hypothetical protein